MMSESYTKYFAEEVDKFYKEHGCYPEKIIMPTEALKGLVEDIEVEERFFGKSELCKYPDLVYKGIKIEHDEIDDWILVAPNPN